MPLQLGAGLRLGGDKGSGGGGISAPGGRVGAGSRITTGATSKLELNVRNAASIIHIIIDEFVQIELPWPS